MPKWQITCIEDEIRVSNGDGEQQVESLYILGCVGDRCSCCFVNFRNKSTAFHERFASLGGGKHQDGTEGFSPMTQENLAQFFLIVHSITPFDRETLITLGNMLRTDLLNRLYSKERMLGALKKNELDRALEIAGVGSSLGYPSYAELADECVTQGNREAYLAVLMVVPATDPYYESAADCIFHCLLSQDDKRLEEAFSYLLRSGDQTVIDCIYDRLCGGNGLNPKLRNVRGNPETLLLLAKEIRELRAENKALKGATEKELPHSFSQIQTLIAQYESMSSENIMERSEVSAVIRDEAMRQYGRASSEKERERLRRVMIRFTAREIPRNPKDTLLSRRHSDFPIRTMQMRCDVIAFNINRETVGDPIFQAIVDAQKSIQTIIDLDCGFTDERKIKWMQDKVLRRQEKPFKIQKKLHLSFLGSIPPGTIKEFLTVKMGQRYIPDQLPADDHVDEPKLFVTPKVRDDWRACFKQANQILKNYMDSKPSGVVRECALNPDGHIVVRVDIYSVEEFRKCKEALSRAIAQDKIYVRHSEPGKQETLAMVIAVVDTHRLSSDAIQQLKETVEHLNERLKQYGEFPLGEIVWRDVENCRTISGNSILRTRSFKTGAGL